jgi:hypothetical protein
MPCGRDGMTSKKQAGSVGAVGSDIGGKREERSH